MATAPETFETETRRNINGVQISLVALVVVVALGAAWFFFLKGDAEPEVAAETPPVTESAPAPSDETRPEGQQQAQNKPGRGPRETTEVFAPKDPFEPLISPAGAATTDTSGSTDTTGDTDDSGDPGVDETPIEDDGTGAPGGGGGSGGGGGGGNTQGVGGREVVLKDVSTKPGDKGASVTVDGVSYEVFPGDRFAKNFKLITVYGQCATMLFGDDQFTLCEGERVLK